VLERKSNDYNLTFTLTGRQFELLNLASYNYLGFAQNKGPCADQVAACIEKYGTGQSSSRMDIGTNYIHIKLEDLVARFVRKPAAIITAMGFATNSTTLPALLDRVCYYFFLFLTGPLGILGDIGRAESLVVGHWRAQFGSLYPHLQTQRRRRPGAVSS